MLIKNSFWGAMATVMNMVAGIVVILVGISLIGSEKFGYISLVISFSLLFLSVNRGMNTVLVRQLHETRYQGERHSPQQLGAGFVYTLLSALSLSAFVFAFDDRIVSDAIYFGNNDLLSEQIYSVLYLVTAATILDLFSMFCASAIEGLGRFDVAAKCTSVYPITLLVGMCWTLWRDDLVGLGDIAFIYLVASVIRLIMTQFVWAKFAGFDGVKYADILAGFGYMRSLIREGVKIQGAGVLTLFIDPFNKMILNFFIGPAAVTHYDLAVRAATSVQNVFSQGFRSFMGLPAGKGTVSVYLRLLGPSLSLAVLMYIVAGVSLALLKGMHLIDVGNEVFFLFGMILPSGLAIVAILPLYHVLVRRGDLDYLFKLTALLAVCNIGFSALLIPLVGLFGAGIGIAIATLINAVSVFRRFSGCVEPIRNIKQHLGGSFLLLGTGFVLMIILPAITLQLFLFNQAVGLSVSMVVILMAIALLWGETRSVWSQKDEIA